MRQYQQIPPNSLQRTSSYTSQIPTANSLNSLNSQSSLDSTLAELDFYNRPLVPHTSSPSYRPPRFRLTAFFRSFVSIFTFPSLLPSCSWLNMSSQLSITPSLGRKVTGTLFGHRKGHVSFAVQDDPRSEPVLLIEFAVSTSALVREMSSGLVRIALECEKVARGPHCSGEKATPATKLFGEPVWTMYCNGKKCGYATSRECGESDWHVLSTVQSVSVGAGVIPVVEDGKKSGGSKGELLYMRARFERVVGSRHSEAFYMLNPDGTGGPDLSIFLLRI